MDYKYILFNIETGIATITLNRVERLNALIVPMVEEIIKALDKCSEDSSPKRQNNCESTEHFFKLFEYRFYVHRCSI